MLPGYVRLCHYCDLCGSLLATGGPQTVTQVGSVDKDTKVGSVDKGF